MTKKAEVFESGGRYAAFRAPIESASPESRIRIRVISHQAGGKSSRPPNDKS
jgi:hypothetical protein